MEGWISLHRKIQLNEFWKEKRRFSRAEAWISILLKANYEDKTFELGSQTVTVKRGSFITSMVKLAGEWGWDRKTVKSFLEYLNRTGMCTTNWTTHYTLISIEKWGLYQNTGQQIGQENGQRIGHKQ